MEWNFWGWLWINLFKPTNSMPWFQLCREVPVLEPFGGTRTSSLRKVAPKESSYPCNPPTTWGEQSFQGPIQYYSEGYFKNIFLHGTSTSPEKNFQNNCWNMLETPVLLVALLARRTKVYDVFPDGTKQERWELPLLMATQLLHMVASIMRSSLHFPCNTRSPINLRRIGRWERWTNLGQGRLNFGNILNECGPETRILLPHCNQIWILQDV